MRNLITLAILIFSTSIISAQSYEQSMQKAFQYWNDGSIQEASALFERIGRAESKDSLRKWLPLYYSANVLVASSFQITDVKKRTTMLEKAEQLIKDAFVYAPVNAEIKTLEGVMYTSYVAMNPQEYGMLYSAKIMGIYNEALAIDPRNPRALLHSTDYEMNTARFFGKDLSEYCERITKIIPIFDSQEDTYPFAPKWGKDRAEQIIKQCKSVK